MLRYLAAQQSGCSAMHAAVIRLECMWCVYLGHRACVILRRFALTASVGFGYTKILDLPAAAVARSAVSTPTGFMTCPARHACYVTHLIAIPQGVCNRGVLFSGNDTVYVRVTVASGQYTYT
jgi:hypothetical protein